MLCEACGELPETFCLCPVPSHKPVSPYGVPVLSVLDPEKPSLNAATLTRFEQERLDRLLSAFRAAEPRVRDAFLLEVTPSALSAGRPVVVRFRG